MNALRFASAHLHCANVTVACHVKIDHFDVALQRGHTQWRQHAPLGEIIVWTGTQQLLTRRLVTGIGGQCQRILTYNNKSICLIEIQKLSLSREKKYDGCGGHTIYHTD